MTNALPKSYPFIGHRPCPQCSQPLVVNDKLDNYECLNQQCPWLHTMVCIPVRLGVYDRDNNTWTPLAVDENTDLLATRRY